MKLFIETKNYFRIYNTFQIVIPGVFFFFEKNSCE